MKFLYSIVLFSIMTIICSCSSSLEDRTKDEALPFMKKIAKDPESVQLSEMEVIYSCDTLCVVEFVMKAKNGFGGYTSSRMQYGRIVYPRAPKVENREKGFYINIEEEGGGIKTKARELSQKYSAQGYDDWTEDEWIYQTATAQQVLYEAFRDLSH